MSQTVAAVPVKYIGGKPMKHDTVGGTDAVWLQGQTILYPADKVSRLFRHPDVWVLGDVSEIEHTAGEIVPGASGSVVTLAAGSVVNVTQAQMPTNRAADAPDEELKGHGISGSGAEPPPIPGPGAGAMLE